MISSKQQEKASHLGFGLVKFEVCLPKGEDVFCLFSFLFFLKGGRVPLEGLIALTRGPRLRHTLGQLGLMFLGGVTSAEGLGYRKKIDISQKDFLLGWLCFC